MRLIFPSEPQAACGKKGKVLVLVHVRDAHVVRGRAQVLVLLAGEDVNADDVRLRVAVLARLGPQRAECKARSSKITKNERRCTTN